MCVSVYMHVDGYVVIINYRGQTFVIGQKFDLISVPLPKKNRS